MNGIFITTELEGDLAKRIHALQEEFDPKMARYLPPHITITGSSGAGPLPEDVPKAEIKKVLEPIVSSIPAIALRFGPPERFVGRNIVSLRLDPHGPLRTLHEKIKHSGLPFGQSRFPFTPHCTLNLYPELVPAKLKKMLAVRVDEPFVVRTIKVYHTHEPQKPDLLLTLRLGSP